MRHSEFSRERRAELKVLEKALSYSFKNLALLEEALTHRSFIHESHSASAHNERLEFLGDAVLALAISHLLMQANPDFPEGDLSKLRAALVNRERLMECAKHVDLGRYLLLGRGEECADGRHKMSLLADAYEAVVGAIYLDRGYAAVFEVIQGQFRELLNQVSEESFLKDYKTQLQEKVQLLFRTVPRYVVKSATGPDHAKVFHVELWVNQQQVASGDGKSKKMAEQAAASQALKQL